MLTDTRAAELTSKVTSWRAATLTGQSLVRPPLHFEPDLLADERKFIHAMCEAGTTISSKSEGKGGERHVVVYDEPVEEGMVGGVSASRRLALSEELDAWKADGGRQHAKEALHFDPALTTAEREYIHQLAKRDGLSSKSEGVVHHGDDWHIVVRLPATVGEPFPL